MSNKQPNLIPKATRKRRTKSPKVSRRKEIIKIRVEIKRNEGDNSKDKNKYINKSWFFEKIHKIYKPLARLINKREDSNQN